MPAILRARHAAALPLLLAFVLVASMFSSIPADAMSQRRATNFRQAMEIVRNQQGDAYRYGADGPGAFDCSGLVYYSFRKAGFTRVPRTSDQQASFADRIRRKNVVRGDLVFFHSGGDVYHVGVAAGMVRGRRTIIHAPYGSERVHREKIWTNSWFPATLR